MPLEPKTLEILAISLIVIVCVELLVITLSYYVAYKVKKTFGVRSFLIYFGFSTVIYFLFFFRMVSQYIKGLGFFENCALFFIIINLLRLVSASVLLISIWTQPKNKD